MIVSGDIWIADNGASCHMTHNNTNMYDIRPPTPGREVITIGDRRRLKGEYIGSLDVAFHGFTDEKTTLANGSYDPCLGFNLYSFYAVQSTLEVVSGVLGAHIIGANVMLPRSSTGSYLRATHLPARAVGAKRKRTCMWMISCGGYNTLFRLLWEPTGIYV